MRCDAHHIGADSVCPDGWRIAPLPDAVTFQEGPGILAKDFREAGVPLVRLKGVEGDFVTLSGCNFLDPDAVRRRWNHFRLELHDLVISTSASFGRVSEVTNDSVGAIPYTGLIRFQPKAGVVEREFLRAFLGSAHFMRQVEAMASGSVIRHFGPMHLKQMVIRVPPISEQHEIGEIYSVIADRLRLLRATNATLEAIAQALFKSWFVDFDPVRAKAEGRVPAGMDAATAALFPSAFEDSELGPIPKGWRVASLDAIADYLNGLALQKYPPESDDEFLPVIKIAQLHAGNTRGADRASARLKPEYVVHDGDVLFSWSGSLEVEVWCGGSGALNQHLFKVTSSRVPKWYAYFATRWHLRHFRDIAANKATTMGHIQRQHLTEAKMAIPPTDVSATLSKFIEPIVDNRVNNALRVRSLEDLRDTLLPRLISGKLRLPNVEQFAEEVA